MTTWSQLLWRALWRFFCRLWCFLKAVNLRSSISSSHHLHLLMIFLGFILGVQNTQEHWHTYSHTPPSIPCLIFILFFLLPLLFFSSSSLSVNLVLDSLSLRLSVLQILLLIFAWSSHFSPLWFLSLHTLSFIILLLIIYKTSKLTSLERSWRAFIFILIHSVSVIAGRCYRAFRQQQHLQTMSHSPLSISHSHLLHCLLLLGQAKDRWPGWCDHHWWPMSLQFYLLLCIFFLSFPFLLLSIWFIKVFGHYQPSLGIDGGGRACCDLLHLLLMLVDDIWILCIVEEVVGRRRSHCPLLLLLLLRNRSFI